MMAAAERIVAERGLPALTLTGVQLAAHQSNKSAATYHFGSRDGLLDALVELRMTPVDAHRRRMLDALDSSGAAPTVRSAVEALVLPLAEETLDRPGSHYARFLAAAVSDPALADLVGRHLRGASFRRVHRLLTELCPAPGEVASWRADNVVVLTMTSLAAREGADRTPAQTAAIVTDLVDTCAAVLTAPTSIPAPTGAPS